jgi:hypothetical protein
LVNVSTFSQMKKMQRFYFALLCALGCAGAPALAQNVGLNNDGTTAHPSAILDMKATDKGMLVPRLTQAQRDAVVAPATGLLVYQTDNTPGFYYYNGTAWVPIGGAAATPGWLLTGNAATATDFIGATTNQPLRFRANNLEHARLATRGALELGMNTSGNLFIGQGTGLNTDLANAGVQNLPNVFVGGQAGQANTIGNANVFLGHRAGVANTSGGRNTFLGYIAGAGNTTGNFNTFVGTQAGLANSMGGQNSFFGFGSGQANTTGNNNTFMGYEAGLTNQTGVGNVFLGYQAGRNLANPSNQLVVANSATNSLLWGDFATNRVGINTGGAAEASAALEVRATDKGVLVPRLTQAQRDAVAAPATGLLVYQTDNTPGFYYYNGTAWAPIGGTPATPGWALDGNAATATDFAGTTSNQPFRLRANNIEHARLAQRGALELGMNTFGNLFIGENTGAVTDLANIIVQQFPNTFVGHRAGEANTVGSGNHFVGYRAGVANTTGVNNHFMGSNTGFSNTTGDENTFIGSNAGFSNTSGRRNHFVGHQAGFNNTTASNNHFVGNRTGLLNTTGFNNTFMGFQAGLNNQTGSGNVFLGHEAGRNLTNPSNQLLIANSATNSLLWGDFATNRVGINTGGAAEASAALEVRATDKGVLVPRLTQAQRDAVATPATGLLVYQTDNTPGFYYNAGTPATPNWSGLQGSNYWTLTGTNITNNNSGNVGIGGGGAPAYQLDVNGRARIRSGGATTNSAGIWFNESGNTERGFVGMENDNSIGLFGNNGGGWGLTMNTNTGKVRIADGTQGTNKILTSDANGVASWVTDNTIQSARVGTFGGGVNIPFADMSVGAPGPVRYTTASIVLPPGRWIVCANLLVNGAALPSGGGAWVRTYLADSPTVGTASADVVAGSGGLISGSFGFSQIFSICSGQVFVNNSSGANKTYHLWCNVQINSAVPNTFAINGYGSSFWGENQFFAIPMN